MPCRVSHDGVQTALSIDAGIKLYRQKKYEKALRIFRRMAKRKSDDPEAHALVGMVLYKLGRYEKAIDACYEALVLADMVIHMHCTGMNAAREMKRDDLVDAAAAKAVNAYDAMFRACYVRAKAQDKFGMVDEPLIDLGVCVDMDDEDPEERRILDMILYRIGGHDDPSGRRAAPVPRELAGAWSSGSGDRLGLRARKLIETFASENAYSYSFPRKSRWDATIGPRMPTMLEQTLASIDGKLELDPKDADAYRNRAHVMHDIGRMRECDEALDAALAIEPDNPKSIATRGLRLYEDGRLEEGRRLVGDGFAKDRLDVTTRFCVAFLMGCEVDRDEAIGECKSALLDYPTSTRLHVLMAAMLEAFADV